jgi:hypothetical protein
MSKGSGSRISDKKKYDDNYDDIFSKKKKRKSKALRVDENVKCDIWGRGTRYHYGDEELERTGTRATTNKKSSAESTLEGL